MSSAPLKNVAVAGASGSLGSVVFKKLVDSGLFDKVTALRRPGSGSGAAAPAGNAKVQVVDVDVDFSSVDALTAALQGHDAVIALFGATSLGLQTALIDASIRAGVQRFLPSEFGSDLQNPHNRTLLPFLQKVEVETYLEKKARECPSFSYTFVYNGAFLDWGLEHDFLLDVSEGGEPTIFDGGDLPFNATTLDTVASGVVGVLAHAVAETRNRAVYIGDFKTTQNELLAAAQRVMAAAGKGKGKEEKEKAAWRVRHTSLRDAVAAADERLAQGIVDLQTIAPYLYRSLFDPAHGGDFQRNDNALLGVQPKSKSVIEEILRRKL
ncbi:NAD(P)-binding domain protein [Moelleriella libera RCEF 2490]|uniref:NAD(P)-binding domain protein n=1 Tax=Moelleriella libera RCEF 2490 TaxID=1081109 RepID=A0A168D5I3_9HYPO|nr:NAD(P)-binding domain protein [Moelleriella libera RCEF 2490]